MTPELLSAKELLEWGDLDAKRRRASRGLAALLTPLWISLVLSAGLGVLLWRRMVTAQESDGASAVAAVDSTIGTAVAAIALAQILVVFGTPYRMYWRSDSALLARLSISGSALFHVALVRTLRAAATAALPAAVSVVVIGAVADWNVALRLTLVSATTFALAALLTPAACLAGGAIVASDKAQSVIDSFGGEVKPPGVAWLGSLPGLVGTTIGLFAIATPAWIIGGRSTPGATEAIACIGAIAVSGLGIAWALRVAGRVLIEAQREVAALDQERLATIERSTAGPLEKVWAGILCRGSARLLFDKDAALMRRRFPAPYFVAFLGIILTWVFAATELHIAAIVVVSSLSAYTLVMARRHSIAPVEKPRLLRALPIGAGSVRTAKRAATTLRTLFWVALPGAAVLVFPRDIVVSIVIISIALVVSLVGGALLCVERSWA